MLSDLIASDARAQELRKASRDWPSWERTERQICDLELLLNGAFSPLEGFVDREGYEGVLEQMRLADGTLWPIPITLDVTEELADTLQKGDTLALRDPEGIMLAAVHVEDIWSPGLRREAEGIFGGRDRGSHRRASGHRLPARTVPPGLCVRARGGPPASGPLRLRDGVPDARRDMGALHQAWLAESRGVPDAQPHAPGTPGADAPHRQRGRSEPADPPCGG